MAVFPPSAEKWLRRRCSWKIQEAFLRDKSTRKITGSTLCLTSAASALIVHALFPPIIPALAHKSSVRAFDWFLSPKMTVNLKWHLGAVPFVLALMAIRAMNIDPLDEWRPILALDYTKTSLWPASKLRALPNKVNSQFWTIIVSRVVLFTEQIFFYLWRICVISGQVWIQHVSWTQQPS